MIQYPHVLEEETKEQYLDKNQTHQNLGDKKMNPIYKSTQITLSNQIDENRLYDHIFNLQGIKHPLTAPEALEKGRNYIKSEFEKIGIEVIEESFELEGCDLIFKNIIGVLDLSDGTEDEVIVSGHHDTVFDAPGANDNASACAAVLEVARVIYENKDTLSGNYRFITFDLEEGHPVLDSAIWELGPKYNVRDRNYFTKLAYKKNHEILYPFLYMLKAHNDRDKVMAKVHELEMDDNEREYYTELIDHLLAFAKGKDWPGRIYLLGSAHYVAQAKLENRKIKGIINLDTVAYTSESKNSQTYPKGLPVILLKIATMPILRSIPFISKRFKATGVKDVTVGNFASLLVDANSIGEADIFFDSSKLIGLKAIGIYSGMNYETLRMKMPDLLRADHAPFWRDIIPGIFISDGANFRYPYYHNGADDITHLNFDFLKKVTQASLLTLIAMAENEVSLR